MEQKAAKAQKSVEAARREATEAKAAWEAKEQAVLAAVAVKCECDQQVVALQSEALRATQASVSNAVAESQWQVLQTAVGGSAEAKAALTAVEAQVQALAAALQAANAAPARGVGSAAEEASQGTGGAGMADASMGEDDFFDYMVGDAFACEAAGSGEEKAIAECKKKLRAELRAKMGSRAALGKATGTAGAKQARNIRTSG